jgi:hypothetical protein
MFAPLVAKPRIKSAEPQRCAVAAQWHGRTAPAQDNEHHAARIAGPEPAPSWDFSKVPVFSSYDAERLQGPPPFPAPHLPSPIHAKLKIGAVNDPLELEADRVADQVLRMPAPGISAAEPPQVSRKCAECEEEKLQKKAAGPQLAAGEAPAIVHDVLRSPGQPLDAATRGFFEPRFGRDFSAVRVHTDAAAAASAREVNANAYTVGRNVAFDAGQFAPGTHEGRWLIAHELTHVVQQSGSDGIHVSQRSEKRGLSPRAPDIGSLLQRDSAKSVTQSLHPEELGVFAGSFRLPSGGGLVYYTVELDDVPALMLKQKRDELELACEAGIRAVLQELLKAGPLRPGLPSLRLRLNAGYSKVLNKGHVEGLVRRAAREEMKRLVAQSQKAESPSVPKAPSLPEQVPVLAELGREVEATFAPAVQGAKEVLEGRYEPSLEEIHDLAVRAGVYDKPKPEPPAVDAAGPGEAAKGTGDVSVYVGKTATSESALREIYRQGARQISEEALHMVKEGASVEVAAGWATQARNDLKAAIRARGSPIIRALAEARNIKKYGDKIGPTFEQLIREGKTPEDIIGSAGRASTKVNRMATKLKVAGRFLIAVDLAIVTWEVFSAPEGERLRAAVAGGASVVGAAGGGWAGAKGLGALGFGIGGPPGAAVGAVIGGIGGALFGGWLGRKTAEKAYDFVDELVNPPAGSVGELESMVIDGLEEQYIRGQMRLPR